MVILSIDGGASRTLGVLFTSSGELLLHRETEATSLSRADADSPQIMGQFIEKLATEAGLAIDDLDLVSVGVAGVSNQDARERLLKELDRLGATDRATVTSDVEAAYETVWGDAPGVLVCVGTGAIGWGRDETGTTYRASGRGPQLGGDPGSGYWLGKQSMVRLIMNERAEDEQLDELREGIITVSGTSNLEDAARQIGEAPDMLSATARLGGIVCALAGQSNDVALAILQEGTQGLAEDLLVMLDESGLRQDSIVFGMNGGIIRNHPIFRRLLSDALCYDVPHIEWRIPEIDPAFGAGLIAARLNDVDVDLDALKQQWSTLHVRAPG